MSQISGIQGITVKKQANKLTFEEKVRQKKLLQQQQQQQEMLEQQKKQQMQYNNQPQQQNFFSQNSQSQKGEPVQKYIQMNSHLSVQNNISQNKQHKNSSQHMEMEPDIPEEKKSDIQLKAFDFSNISNNQHAQFGNNQGRARRIKKYRIIEMSL